MKLVIFSFITITVVKYKNDETYQILIKGKIIKIDPKAEFKQSKVLLNSLFDPSEYL